MYVDRTYRMFFLWISQKLMYLWARSKSFPSEHACESLGIDPTKPICYLLKSHSWIDWCILDRHCAQLGLPQPSANIEELENRSMGAYLYLFKTGFFQQIQSENVPTKLLGLIKKCAAENFEVQLVPVSIFRGRNPGKEEKSLIKLLFFDDENGGWFQKLFTFFVQGRQLFCQYGKVISIQNLIQEGREDLDTARKLHRVVRVHFRRQREAVLGPNIYDRNHVLSTIVSSREIQKIIERESTRNKQSRETLEKTAYKYADEIAAKFMFPVLLFFDILLSWLWKKMYRGVEVRNGEFLSKLKEEADIVYLPCHRSHMDYLLFGYSLYHLGLMPPHTAAGVNLNFWPVGPIFRRGGAFFIRRSFAGNRIYGAVFSEYVHYLLTHGFPMSFYIEGGRSRTGYLLPPKTGLLTMVLQSYLRSHRRPLKLVPVYITYDRLMEGGSYIREIRGKTKKAESMGQLFKARKLLQSEFGKAYISFAEPIDVADFIGENLTREHVSPLTNESVTKGLLPTVQNIAKEAMQRINDAAVVTPIGIFATAVLAAPQKAMVEKDLLQFVSLLLSLLDKTGRGQAITFSRDSLQDQLHYAEGLTALQRFTHKGGDILYINEQEALLVTYYRNNMIHLFSLSSLIASFFQHNHQMEKEKLLAGCMHLYPFIREEFCLSWTAETVASALEINLQAFYELELLIENEGIVTRCDVKSHTFSQLKLIGNMLRDTIEKYAIFSVLLLRHREENLTTHQFETECQFMLKRLSILNRIEDAHFFSKNSLHQYLELLSEQGHISTQGHIHVHDSLEALSQSVMELLSPDIRESILQSCLSPQEKKETP